MSRQLKKADCWKKPRIRVGEGLIEISEKKTIATFAVAILLLWTFGLLGLLSLGMMANRQFDLGVMIAVAIVQGIPLAIVLAIYRPPRVLRLYPDEMLAQRYRAFIWFKFNSKWHDLSEAAISVERRLGQGDSELTGLGAAIGCLLMFTGPLSFLFALLGPKKHKQIPFYCLTHVSEGRRPIAVFSDRATPARLVDLYQALEQAS